MDNKGHHTTACELPEYDDCKIILIENHPCNDMSWKQERDILLRILINV